MRKTGTTIDIVACTITLLLVTLTSAHAQFVHEELFPSMPLYVNNAQLYPGNSTLLVFGQIGTTSYGLFDDWSGYSIPFLFTQDSLSLSPPTFVPDTSTFWYWAFGGSVESSNYSLAFDSDDNVIVCWSKLLLEPSDVPPTYLSKPVLRSLSYSHGTLSNFFSMDSALNPQVAYDKNNTAHIVWEKITSLDSFPPSLPGRFTKYSSEVFYMTRLSNGTLSIPVSLGKGFSPQILIAPDNSVDVLWFGADSSSTTSFQLLYRRSNSSSFTAPVALHGFASSLSPFNSYLKLPILGLSIDSSNTVHYCWWANSSYPFSKFYVLHYNGVTGVQIDSSADYIDTSIKFLFKSDGEVDAAWLSRTTINGPAQFFYSSSADGKLFSQVRMFSSIPVNGSLSLIKDQTDSINAMIWGSGEIQIIKNVPSGKDTLYSIPTGETTVMSTCVDRSDKVVDDRHERFHLVAA